MTQNDKSTSAQCEFVQTLTDEERAEFRVVADELANTAPRLVDDPSWLRAARTLSGRVPLRVRELLREYGHDAGPDGLLLLRNLPVGAALPHTPSEPGSVERASTSEAAVSALVSLQLGEMVAYRNEKEGALVQNVVPVPGQEEAQSNAGSSILEMHTENAFHPHRPDYLALFCLRSDHGEVAGTQVSSIRRVLHLLSEQTSRTLFEPRFVTDAPPSFGGQSGRASACPILQGDVEDPDVCVDFHATHACDNEAGQALEDLRNAFAKEASTIVLRAGDMVIVDNRVSLHGRAHFSPRYDGRDRWLHRTFMHRDHRRSRASRPGNGHVLL